MGRDRHYVLGDFYRVDDRTGFPERAKRTRKEWTGLIVHRDRWEARQPQDFVKGVFDDQTVPDPRPLPTDLFVGPLQTSIAAPVVLPLNLEDQLTVLNLEHGGELDLETGGSAAGATKIAVVSTTGMLPGDTIQIMLDTFVLFTTTIVSIPTFGTIIIANPLPYSASGGNFVQDLTQDITVAPSRAENSEFLGG